MLKILGLGLGAVSAIATAFICYQSMTAFNQLSKHSKHVQMSHEPETKASDKTEHGGGGHEAKAEAKAEEGHGGGHGSGHEAAPQGEKRETASAKMVPFLSLDELFANINQEKISHTLAIKVDIEFFDVEAKQAFKSNQPAVKNLILQTSREQEYDQLSTLSGKLYYKELLIRRINEYFQKPLVKNVHFASFFLQ
ncbi:MAG: flagellar basal body-associated FliL family protein [Pseudomonadota bacterium]